MNNWYLNFIALALAFLALGIGLTAGWIASFIIWDTNLQKGIGFLAAGIGVILVDIVVRNKFDPEGIYLQFYLAPFVPLFRIPAYAFGLSIAVGGIVVLSSKG